MNGPGEGADELLRPARLGSGRRQLHLVGFMGSGKSTVGREVAQRMLWNFLDLDVLVVRHAGRSIPEIFEGEGEEGFRAHERHALRQAVQKPWTVVALGGGTFVEPDNRELSRREAVSVWLRCSFATLAARVGEAEARPLWEDRAAVRRLWERRQDAYSRADHVVDGEAAADRVATAILEAISADRRGR